MAILLNEQNTTIKMILLSYLLEYRDDDQDHRIL